MIFGVPGDGRHGAVDCHVDIFAIQGHGSRHVPHVHDAVLRPRHDELAVWTDARLDVVLRETAAEISFGDLGQ